MGGALASTSSARCVCSHAARATWFGVILPDFLRLCELDCSGILLVAPVELGAGGVGCIDLGENLIEMLSMSAETCFVDVDSLLGGAIEEPAVTPQLMS